MSDVKAAAEARRQRILARGEERLTKITYGTSTEAGGDGPAPTQAESTKQAIEIPVPQDAPPERPAQEPTTSSQAPSFNLGDTNATSNQTKKAAPQLQPGNETRTTTSTSNYPVLSVAKDSTELRRRALTEPDPTMAEDLPSTAPTLQPASLANSSTSDVRIAVRYTRLIRVLMALVLAQALFMETLLPSSLLLPPVVVLMLLQVLVIMGTRALVSSGIIKRIMLPDMSAGQHAPRVLQLTSLVPGLKEVAAAWTAAQEVVGSVFDVVAVYVVATVLLHTTAGASRSTGHVNQ